MWTVGGAGALTSSDRTDLMSLTNFPARAEIGKPVRGGINADSRRTQTRSTIPKLGGVVFSAAAPVP